METEIRRYPEPEKLLEMARTRGQQSRGWVPYLLGNKEKNTSQAGEGPAEQFCSLLLEWEVAV